MIKTIHVTLPVYLKKFYMHEYYGYETKEGFAEIHINKHSELGKLVHLSSRPIPYTQKAVMTSDSTLSIRYYSHVQAVDVPNEKLEILAGVMDEIFRRTIICEVRGGQELTGCNYGILVGKCLERRGIERDIDIDFQTVRKVYRDYISKNKRRIAKRYAQKVTQMRNL